MKPTSYPKLSVAAVALVAGGLLSACAPPPQPAPPKPYELVVLDAAGTDGVFAYGISPDGSVIGGYANKQIDGNPGTVGAVWDDEGLPRVPYSRCSPPSAVLARPAATRALTFG